VGGLLVLPGFARLEGAVAPPAVASPCTLGWKLAQNGSVAGYVLYCGITGSTTNRQILGMTNTVTLFNLLASSNYVFFLTTYDANGVESPPSGVISYKPQMLSSVNLTLPVQGMMNLQFRAAPGTVCRVQYTPTLSPPQWQTLGSATADSNGNITMTDQPPANTPARFYRAVTP